ncbi:pyridoxamine 5'-phosphate oxidase family protein [Aeromicrobium sp.]|uniref:pyridoxamine 5'-phosphate oxidase family protein n=1 Tax=Aeromicrobium sp. TaxID=1871063 RepID=UPI003D6C027F
MSLPPRAALRGGHLTEIEPDDCWSLLDTTTVGRLAFSTDEGIVILPVNFILFEFAVYFRTNPGTTIARLGEGCDDVAFEVDHHEDLFQRGWNVLLRGSTATVDAEEAARALDSSTRLGPWAPGERSLMIKLTPRRVDGRRVSLH